MNRTSFQDKVKSNTARISRCKCSRYMRRRWYTYPKKEKEKRKKICAFKVISDAKKTSFHLSMKQGLFNFYYSKYLISRIKIFTSDGINQICENNFCSCIFLLACLGQSPLSFSLSIPPPEKEGKTEKEKGFQKEKDRKLRRKIESTSFLFSSCSSDFSPQKEI